MGHRPPDRGPGGAGGGARICRPPRRSDYGGRANQDHQRAVPGGGVSLRGRPGHGEEQGEASAGAGQPALPHSANRSTDPSATTYRNSATGAIPRTDLRSRERGSALRAAQKRNGSGAGATPFARQTREVGSQDRRTQRRDPE